MRQGGLRLPNGFSILCSYRFDSDFGGQLELSTALHNSLPTASEARLTQADGKELPIRIVLGPAAVAAEFEVIAEASQRLETARLMQPSLGSGYDSGQVAHLTGETAIKVFDALAIAGEVREQFAAGAAAYGTGSTGWHRNYAERLVDLAALKPGATVIDAGCGNGLAAFAAAQAVGPSGSVLGLDIVEAMVQQAQLQAAARGIVNIRFAVGDAASFPEIASVSVDAVVCASALIYMPVTRALREWHRVLRPGGRVAFSTLQVGSPRVSALFRACASRFGIDLPDPNATLGTAELSGSALRANGFVDIQIVADDAPIEPLKADGLWEQQAATAVHRDIRETPRDIQNEIRDAFRAEVTESDLREPMHVLYALARRSV